AALETGAVVPQPQDSALATLAPILKKDDGLIDWNSPAKTIFNRSRGFLPWPGTYTFFRGDMFHLWKCLVGDKTNTGREACATLMPEKRRLFVRCGQGTALELLEVQIEGRKRVSAEAFLNGHRLEENESLGATH